MKSQKLIVISYRLVVLALLCFVPMGVAAQTELNKILMPQKTGIDNLLMPLTVSISDAKISKAEANEKAFATFTIMLSKPVMQFVSVGYYTSDDTAEAFTDYEPIQSGIVHFLPGETIKLIKINLIGNIKTTSSKSFRVNLTNPYNTNIDDGVGIGIISQNTTAESNYLIITPTIIRVYPHATFLTVQPHDPAADGNLISLRNLGIIPGDEIKLERLGDFSYCNEQTPNCPVNDTGTDLLGVFSSSSNLGPRDTNQRVLGAIGANFWISRFETSSVTLKVPAGAKYLFVATPDTYYGDNIDPDGDFALSVEKIHRNGININNSSVIEGAYASFDITLSVPMSNSVTVDLSTSNGTAIVDEDYKPVNGTLTFNPSETNIQLFVRTYSDLDVEPDETFFVNLSNPSGAPIGNAQGMGTIENDDKPEEIEYFSSSYSVREDESTATITVIRDRYNAGTSVSYTVTGGTATAGQDYILTGNVLTFEQGETIKSFTIDIINDDVFEQNETIELTLSNPTNGAVILSPSTVTLTIVDDDNVPGISVDNVINNEGNLGTITPFVFTVSLTNPSKFDASVRVSAGGGTAVAGVDYEYFDQTLTFLPGEISKTVTINVKGDNVPEPDATFFVNLSNAVWSYPKYNGTGTIINDDGTIPCTYTFNTGNRSYESPGITNDSFTVTTSIGCAFTNWTAGTTVPWITITGGGSGSGSGTTTISYRVSPNTGAARHGYITVGNKQILIGQRASCIFSLPTNTANISAANGQYNFSVNVNTIYNYECVWVPNYSSVPWLTVTVQAYYGSATVPYTVQANIGSTRSTKITDEKKNFSFVINQASGCTYTLPILNTNVSENGGQGSFNINTSSANCIWNAVSNASWIKLDNLNGLANQLINYTIEPNSGAGRTGTINVSGKTYTINQAASTITENAYKISGRISENSVGKSSVNVNLSGTHSSNTITDTNGNYTFDNLPQGNYTVIPNLVGYTFSPNSRSFNNIFANYQTADFEATFIPCSYSINTTSASISSSGTQGSITVNTGDGCAWTAATNDNWITITSGGSGSGNFAYTVAPNFGAARSGTITVAGHTFTVNQNAGNLPASSNFGVTEAFTNVSSIVVQPDSKILIAGTFTKVNGSDRRSIERLNADGTRDTTFNPNGIGTDYSVSYIALQPDGKIIIVGGFGAYNGVPTPRNVIRLNLDGTLDTAFNSSGSGTNNWTTFVALQPDGKILIAGDFTEYNNVPRSRIARLNSDGSLDTTFNPGSGADNIIDEIAMNPADGKIYVSGSFTNFGGIAANCVTRLNTDGSRDVSFNIGTGPTYQQNSGNCNVNGLAVQSNSKVLIGGNFGWVNGFQRNGIARLNTDGSVDTGFNVNEYYYVTHIVIELNNKILVQGIVDYPEKAIARLNEDGSRDASFQSGAVDDVSSVAALQSDGNILLSGHFTEYGGGSGYLKRLSANGAVDTNFNPIISNYGVVRDFAVQSDGKTLVAGQFKYANFSPQRNIARFNTDGSLDSTFSSAFRSFNYSEVSAVAVQSDGKILIGGSFVKYGTVDRRGIARLNSDGSLDTTFDFTQTYLNQVYNIRVQPDGKILVGASSGGGSGIIRLNSNGTIDTSFAANTGANNTVLNIELQLDGNILIGGRFTSYNGTNVNRIARLNPDGSLDASFNTGTGANDAVYDIHILPNGKIYIGGLFWQFNGVDRQKVARLNSDGSLDNTFNLGAVPNGVVFSLMPQDSGKIFVGGDFRNWGNFSSPLLVQLNSNGSIDTAFTSNLKAEPTSNIYAFSPIVGGKIIAGGSFTEYNNESHYSLLQLDSEPALPTYTISGNVKLNGTNLSGVNMTLTGNNGNSAITDASGNYSFTNVIGGSNYTVTPSLGNYVFNPSQADFISLSANQTANFTASCAYSVNPASVNLAAASSTGNAVQVIAPSGCAWTAASNANWITISGGSSGSGNGTVTFDVSANTASASRTGTITIAGKTFTVTQFDTQNNADPTFNAGVTEQYTSVFTTAVQPDDKILIGGLFTFVNGIERHRFERLNADGTRDVNFNQNGIGFNAYVYKIAVQPDGKILAGGGFSQYNGLSVPRYLVRLNSDGSVDTTFDSGGAGINNAIYDIVVQPDGKILIGGFFTQINGIARNYIARLNSDGSVDTTFDPGSGGNSGVNEIELQADGKILVGGYFSTFNGAAHNALVRLNADGSLDTNFNFGIGATNQPDSETGQILGIAAQSNGSIFIGGSFGYINGTPRSGLAKLNSDGSLDMNFTDNGGYIQYITTQPDDKVLVGGGFDYEHSYALTRYNADGSLDTSFQRTTVNFANANSISVQSTGKILIGGNLPNFGNTNRRLFVRVNSNGAFDSSFNPEVTSEGFVDEIVVQPDGKFLVAGDFFLANGTQRINIARFNADSTLDGSFVSNSPEIYRSITALDVQTDGKILIGGNIENYAYQSIPRFTRLNEDGSRDTTFNPDLTISNVNTVQCIKVQPDGKILLGGFLYNIGGSSFRGLVRLNTDGTLDSAFNTGAGANGAISDIELQTDGKILIGGNFSQYNGVAQNRITRLNTDGSLDGSFIISNVNGSVVDLALQNDGKILIANSTSQGVVRLNPDGSVDSSFNTGTGVNSIVYSIAIQPNGKIFIGGFFSSVNGTERNRLARLNSDGSLDTAFVSGFDNNSRYYVRELALQTGGKVLAGGIFKSYSGVARDSLVRLSSPLAYSAPTPIGQSVSVAPTSNTGLTFSNVTTAGETTVTVLSVNQIPSVPSGFTILANDLVYDITTTAQFSGSITVTFNVPNITNTATCNNLRILHYENGAWTSTGNSAPQYNAAQQTCTLRQTVSSLSPFVIVQIDSNPSSASILGNIIYGTTPANQSAKFVPGVSLSLTGSSNVSTTTNNLGNYLLSQLISGGSYLATPTKTGGANGITSFDATQILRYVAAGGGTLNSNQQAAADTNGSNSVTSFDATQILRYVAAGGMTAQTGQTTNWKFLPSSRSYNSLGSSLTDENYEAILIGDVNGSWQPPASSNLRESINEPLVKSSNALAGISISLPPNASASTGSIITIPVMLNTNNSKMISSYSFAVNFDQNILQPENPAVDKARTLSNNFTVISDTNTQGRLGVAAAGGNDTITNTGILLNLRFRVVGQMGTTNLTFNQILFEDDNGNTITTTPTNGSFMVMGPTAANVSVSGRVLERNRGVERARVSFTDPEGNVRSAMTNQFGYYRFENVAVGQTYIFEVAAKGKQFAPQVVSVNDAISGLDFNALE